MANTKTPIPDDCKEYLRQKAQEARRSLAAEVRKRVRDSVLVEQMRERKSDDDNERWVPHD
jgi:hypothetical protein